MTPDRPREEVPVTFARAAKNGQPHAASPATNAVPPSARRDQWLQGGWHRAESSPWSLHRSGPLRATRSAHPRVGPIGMMRWESGRVQGWNSASRKQSVSEITVFAARRPRDGGDASCGDGRQARHEVHVALTEQ